MKKILILYAHPSPRKSVINRALKDAIQNIEGVTFHDLYAAYPHYLIDVKHEQQLCSDHDIIIFQHPFYWYSSPSIIKEWCDIVLQHNWAYGSKGRALEGKICFHALSAGGDESSYTKGGMNQYSLEELLRPQQATSHLCKMKWLPPFAVLGAHRGIDPVALSQHAESYRKMVLALRNDKVILKNAVKAPYLNYNLDKVIEGA